MARTKLDSTDVALTSPSEVFDDIYVPEKIEIEIVPASSSGGGDSQHFEELRFMEEVVEIIVHESTDSNAENPVFTSVNGVAQYFYRGQVTPTKRKYVYVLASCKEHAVSTPEYTTRDGSRSTSIRRTSSLKYPFSIVSDQSPRGATWLKSVLSAPT